MKYLLLIFFIPERTDIIINIVEREPLTTCQIEALSPYSSDRYLVPFQRTKSRPCGIILYTTVDRKGADEEASKIADSFKLSGCDVFKLQWSSTSELRGAIDDIWGRIRSGCSLLYICLMAHGYSGTLSGGDGSDIPINNLLSHLSSMLPNHLPLVSIDSIE